LTNLPLKKENLPFLAPYFLKGKEGVRMVALSIQLDFRMGENPLNRKTK
jgi:hypothetical protein